VRHNRRPTDASVAVGDLAAQWLGQNRFRAAERLCQLVRLVGQRVDCEFRQHCSLGSAKAGVLSILVDDESLVQAMRLRWLLVLRDLLDEHHRGGHVTEIRFSAGRGELSFPAPQTDGEDEQSPGGGQSGAGYFR
jgi:hypothetical protein